MRFVKAKPIPLLVILTALLVFQGAATAQQPKASQPATGAEEEQVAAPAPSLADLILKAGELNERLTDLEESLEEAFDPAEAEGDFARIEEGLGDLSSRFEDLQITKNVSYDQLIQLKVGLQTEGGKLQNILEPITSKLRRVAALRSEWSKEKKQWIQWQAYLEEYMEYTAVQSTFTRAQETIANARTSISQNLEPLLMAAQRGGNSKPEPIHLWRRLII